MSGVSVTVGSSDPVLDNLAILADPTKFQERLAALQKATLESTEAWTRIRKAETAEAMLQEAEKRLEQAKAKQEKVDKDTEASIAKAKSDSEAIIAKATKEAEETVAIAKADAAATRSAANKTRDSATAKETKASNLMALAEAKLAEAEALGGENANRRVELESWESKLAQREKDLEQKITALSSMANILGVK